VLTPAIIAQDANAWVGSLVSCKMSLKLEAVSHTR
jgi:hypothetical protein